MWIAEFFHDSEVYKKRKWPRKGIPGKAGGRQDLKVFLPTPGPALSQRPPRSLLWVQMAQWTWPGRGGFSFLPRPGQRSPSQTVGHFPSQRNGRALHSQERKTLLRDVETVASSLRRNLGLWVLLQSAELHAEPPGGCGSSGQGHLSPAFTLSQPALPRNHGRYRLEAWGMSEPNSVRQKERGP